MSDTKKTNIILFKRDYDKAMAAYNHDVTSFHTFWAYAIFIPIVIKAS